MGFLYHRLNKILTTISLHCVQFFLSLSMISKKGVMTPRKHLFVKMSVFLCLYISDNH